MKTVEIFQAPTGEIEFRGDVEHETVWASQKQIAELFAIDRTVVSRHIKNIFKDDELDKEVVCAKFAHTTSHGAIETKTQTKELFNNLKATIEFLASKEKDILVKLIKYLIFESKER